MGNTAHLKFRKRITLPQFQGYLQQALAATFGDALTPDGSVTDRGLNLRNEAGVCLVQFWCETRGHISVDHRHGAVGYMVADAMMAWLARHLNGRVFETSTGEYMDLTREYPVYFTDTVRREHSTLTAEGMTESLAEMTADAKRAHGHLFTGKFARFWERVGVPIEEEPKPLDALAIERCCLCRTKTRWWTKLPDRTPGGQVALCPKCAETATPENIPTKGEWCDKERALDPRPYSGGYSSPWAILGKDPS